MDTPYQWTKQVASHWGGTRNGTILHWPAGIQAKGKSAASSTVIEWRPRCWRWPACPSRPASMACSSCPCTGSAWPTFDDADAAEQRETQYFELAANRGIYHQGWRR